MYHLILLKIATLANNVHFQLNSVIVREDIEVSVVKTVMLATEEQEGDCILELVRNVHAMATPETVILQQACAKIASTTLRVINVTDVSLVTMVILHVVD